MCHRTHRCLNGMLHVKSFQHFLFSPPPYQAPRMAQVLGGPFFYSDIQAYSLHGSLDDISLPSFDEHQLQLLLGIKKYLIPYFKTILAIHSYRLERGLLLKELVSN